MFDKTNKGQWWDQGWKLVEGCTPVSPACSHCWSMAMEKRFRKETGVVFHSERLDKPLKIKKPTSFAIWNDLFHESVPFEWINAVFSIMSDCDHHTYQILTKRPQRVLDFYSWKWEQIKENVSIDNDYIPWQPKDNIWTGVTAENQKTADERIPVLLQIPSKVRFVSCEPLLSGINFVPILGYPNETYQNGWYGIDWLIAGRETGPKARPMKKEWIENIYDQCKAANVPFFDKRNILGLNIKQYPA